MRDKSYIVYKHINKINGKVYIGITKLAPNNRWREGKGYSRCILFYNAIKKYGWDNFDHIILCNTSEQNAKLLEATWIKFFKDKGISYNISNGGEGVGVVAESTREKLRQYTKEKSSMYGKHPSEETLRKRVETRRLKDNYTKDPYWLAIYRLRKGADSPMYGRKPSDNTLLAHRKVIEQYSINGEYITKYKQIKDASIALGISSSAIVNCLKGKTQKAGGYKWKYKNE